MMGPDTDPISQRKIIVECPSCQTRFGVKSELVQGQRMPHFHCSKCDTVFKVDLTMLRSQQPLPFNSNMGQLNVVANNIRKKAGNITSSNLHNLHRNEEKEEANYKEEDAPDKNQLSFLGDTKKPGFWGKFLGKPLLSDNSWHDLFTAIMPVAAFLFALMLASGYFFFKPSAAEGILQRLHPQMYRPAPAGLYIKETSVKRTNLDSGEEIILISGEIVNSTSSSFNDIMLQARLYDKNEDTLDEIIATAASTLSNTTIQSLSPEMIRGIQRSRLRSFLLKPGANHRFTLAFTDGLLHRAQLYSIRIYSVRPALVENR
ncbi:MAG: hypothetical protein D6808_03990 [Candidatus Dadabacteria bacterium]|nr:MAG: hypothetical protein D6808_03990 [Candidatus Dadabacteria bacterium]